MTYKHIVDFVKTEKLSGYIVFSNADIYLDETIENVFKTTLSVSSSWYAQLRIEAYNNTLFGPSAYAQDTWIFHTKPFEKKEIQTKPLDFCLGILGCDNKIVYQLGIQNIQIFNEPLFIKTYHLHKSVTRDYTIKDRLSPPYLQIIPNLGQK